MEITIITHSNFSRTWYMDDKHQFKCRETKQKAYFHLRIRLRIPILQQLILRMLDRQSADRLWDHWFPRLRQILRRRSSNRHSKLHISVHLQKHHSSQNDQVQALVTRTQYLDITTNEYYDNLTFFVPWASIGKPGTLHLHKSLPWLAQRPVDKNYQIIVISFYRNI